MMNAFQKSLSVQTWVMYAVGVLLIFARMCVQTFHNANRLGVVLTRLQRVPTNTDGIDIETLA